MSISPLAHLVGALRRARVRRQRKQLKAARARLVEIRAISRSLVDSQIAAVAEAEAKLGDMLRRYYGTTTRQIAASIEARAKGVTLS